MFKYLVFALALFLSAPIALASQTDGTIDPNLKYAWGERLGWINFGTSGGNIHVTDAGLTGHAWSSNFGWINLAPAGSGVTNNAEGDLNGFAWGQNIGYVDFGQVGINSSGRFTGTASSSLGVINFDCGNCGVLTDWVKASLRQQGGGISGAPPVGHNTDITLTTSSKSEIIQALNSLVNLISKINKPKEIYITPPRTPARNLPPPAVSIPISPIPTSTAETTITPIPISPIASTTVLEEPEPQPELTVQKPRLWARFLGFMKYVFELIR